MVSSLLGIVFVEHFHMKRFGSKNGVYTRACSVCGGDLGDRYMKQRYCKKCHALHMRNTRPKHSELTEEARKKANTRSYTNVLLRRGKIKKEPCVECGSTNSQAHHKDYNNPRDVTWLCRECHLKHHKLLQ